MRSILICTFLIIYHGAHCCAQGPEIVTTEGIKSDLQRKNIGKIFFTDRPMADSQLKETDFLKKYTLTIKSDLYLVAFFDNSLTNHLHRLAPGLAADSLVQLGNYQFSLSIDRKPVYSSNLYPGAPQARTQDIATGINKPLIDNVNSYGLWSESFWNRFLDNGGDSVLTDGKHVMEMEIRPYIKTTTLKVGDIIARGEIDLEVLRHPVIDVSDIQLNRIRPYNGIEVSSERFDRQKIKELKANIGEGVFKKINGIVVLKDGRLLIEEYFNGENRHSLHDSRSVGKSFASSLIGMAIAEGYIDSEASTLNEFYDIGSFSNYSALKENTSLKELLTMSSNFDGDDSDYQSPGNEERMYPMPDWVEFTLGLPIRPTDPPRDWHYFTAGVVLLGDILDMRVKGGLEAYADEKLFGQLGITDYQWQFTPQNVPNTAGGIRMSALDFAKYGQLYKDKGKWKGKQVIPADWIEKSLSKEQKIRGRDNEYYGYLFWNRTYEANGRSYEAYYCAGNGGNYILVFKDLPVVIVITASAYGRPYAHAQVTGMLSEYILPAVLK